MIITSLAYMRQRGQRYIAILLACLFFVASCGQTGALYLPESQVQAATEAPPDPAANDNIDNEERERRAKQSTDTVVDALP